MLNNNSLGYKIYSAFKVYRNPVTGELASLFTHKIKCIISTDDMTIECDGNKASKMLVSLGFTEEVSKGLSTYDLE